MGGFQVCTIETTVKIQAPYLLVFFLGQRELEAA
jgi:hypothetical protein